MQGWPLRGRRAPLWAVACQMSEAWHVPPWVIWERPDAMIWINRMQIYQVERHAAQTKGPLPPLGPSAPHDYSAFTGDIPYAVLPED